MAYSGKQWTVAIGVSDSNAGASAGAVGAGITEIDNLTGNLNLMRVASVNDIAWDAGYTAAEVTRVGNRSVAKEDYMNHYGSGTWTWDFEYVVDSATVMQQLLQMVYPDGGVTSTVFQIPAVPAVPGLDYSHGNETTDKCAVVCLSNPLTTKDRVLTSAILQNLTLAMDVGTDGGRLKSTGQFMTGYKPAIKDEDASVTSPAVDYAKTIFDCSTHTLGGAAAGFKSFSVTIDNPASRVGYQGASFETDGYVRANPITLTGNAVVKADSTIQALLESKWQANATFAISLTGSDASKLQFDIPQALMTNFSMDMADDGIYATIDFICTAGSSYGANPLTIKTVA